MTKLNDSSMNVTHAKHSLHGLNHRRHGLNIRPLDPFGYLFFELFFIAVNAMYIWMCVAFIAFAWENLCHVITQFMNLTCFSYIFFCFFWYCKRYKSCWAFMQTVTMVPMNNDISFNMIWTPYISQNETQYKLTLEKVTPTNSMYVPHESCMLPFSNWFAQLNDTTETLQKRSNFVHLMQLMRKINSRTRETENKYNKKQ